MNDRRSPADESENDRFVQLGTIALAAGLLLVLARALETSHGIPAMPRFWYQNDSVWWLVGLAGIGAGSWLLGRAEHKTNRQESWKPSIPGKRFHQLILYTRDGCKLCDEAEELIEAYGRWLPSITPVNIESDPKLVEQYGTCVPVVTLDGRVRFRGRIHEALLRRLIEGTPPVPSVVRSQTL